MLVYPHRQRLAAVVPVTQQRLATVTARYSARVPLWAAISAGIRMIVKEGSWDVKPNITAQIVKPICASSPAFKSITKNLSLPTKLEVNRAGLQPKIRPSLTNKSSLKWVLFEGRTFESFLIVVPFYMFSYKTLTREILRNDESLLGYRFLYKENRI